MKGVNFCFKKYYSTKVFPLLNAHPSYQYLGRMVWIKTSVARITDWHHEACRVIPKVIRSDGFFYPHHTPMIDTFSCIPFDISHLIFEVVLAIK